MNTEVLCQKSLSRAVELMRTGELVAFPTETVYGLGARVFDPEAIGKIFLAKGRPSDNPLIAHVSSAAQWETLASEVPESFHRLCKAFFPGPLALIVRKKKSVPLIATGGLQTVAIRCPDHPLALELIESVGQPIVAPSANLSGRPSSTTSAHVLSDFNGAIAAIVEGGSCVHGLESTVVDLVSFESPTIVRPGAISKQLLEAELKEPVALYTSGPKSAPGMRYRHYSPNIPVYLFTSSSAFEKYLALGRNTFPIPHYKLRGKTLYSLLRHADASGYSDIAIDRSLCTDPALLNRLEKMGEH